MATDIRQRVHQLLDNLPDSALQEVLDFIGYLRWRILGKTVPLTEPLLSMPAMDSPSVDFWRGATVEELAAQQGVSPVNPGDELWGDFWPEDQDVAEFRAAVREWRQADVNR